ncbi:MAG: B12-binding domain-containing radical SAM protein [Spirochaetota bacterium]
MKILLISPCKDAIRRPKFLMIPQLALHLLASLTPAGYQVKIVEEEIEEIDFEQEADLVGISCMTANAPRAYWIAQKFKQRGRTVVMGGIHPTILPDEALSYADCVVVGEAEEVWEGLLEDFKNGRLRKKYHKYCPSLKDYPQIQYRKETKKRLFNVIPVLTTRGCPYKCEFCSVHHIYGPRIRHIPIERIVQYINDSGGKFFLFLDDNIVGDPGYARELFTQIKPLGIKYVAQASISIARDQALLKLAAESGCRALYVGVETITTAQMKKLRKSIKDMEKVRDAIKRIKDCGIYFHASMIFGFDEDTRDIFPETIEFLQKNRISSASMNVLTPYPGTRIYAQYKKEGRLLTENWSYYNHKTAVYVPKNMSAFELQSGRLWALREFTKLSSILRRYPFHLDHPFYHFTMNMGYHIMYKRDVEELNQIAPRLFQKQNLAGVV